jgi:hypothetical protein
MRVVWTATVAALFMAGSLAAQQPQTNAPPVTGSPATGPQAPAAQTAPPPPTPGAPGTTTPGVVVPSAGPPAPVAARAFAAPAGLLFNTVRADRVADFEQVMGYLRAALEKSPDPTVRAQARGWRVFKATEPGPSATVLYVYVIDPTVPGADYALGPILAQAYPDQAQLQEIWRLYTGSVTGGGTLLNLTPLQPVAPTPVGVQGPVTPGPARTPAPAPVVPPDADPNRR